MRSTWRVSVLGFAVILLLIASTVVVAETPLIIGEHRRDVVLETPHPYPSGAQLMWQPVWSDHYYFPDARYLVFEFQRFDLAPGDRVEIRDPRGRQVHVYEGRGFKDKGGDFISKMIEVTQSLGKVGMVGAKIYFHDDPKRAAKILIALEQMHHDVDRVVIDAHSLVMTYPAPSLELLSHFVDQGRLDTSALRCLEGDLAALLADKPGPRELILTYLAGLAKSVSDFDDGFASNWEPTSPDEWARRLIDLRRNIDGATTLDTLPPLLAKTFVHLACHQAGLLQDNNCSLPQEIVRSYYDEVATIRTLLGEIREAIESKS